MAGPKMLATLPSGDGNGLTAILAAMIASPEEFRVAICIVDCKGINYDTDTGDRIPTVRVRRIEPITERGDMDTAEVLMRRAAARRNVGDQDELPLDFEEDLKAAFGDDPG